MPRGTAFMTTSVFFKTKITLIKNIVQNVERSTLLT